MKLICGLDEVGRGALAGPMLMCASVYQENKSLKQKLGNLVFRDSKKMTKLQRNKIVDELKNNLVYFETLEISVDEINQKGIGLCNAEGFRKLIKKIKADEYIVDGNLKINLSKTNSVVKADNLFETVMASSIIAKVTRDILMHNLHQDFPNYDFLNNVGYGTKKHIEAIKKFGITKHHRIDFVKNIIATI